MDTSSEPAAAAFHGCRSATGSDRPPPDTRNSSGASISERRAEMPALHRTGNFPSRRWGETMAMDSLACGAAFSRFRNSASVAWLLSRSRAGRCLDAKQANVDGGHHGATRFEGGAHHRAQRKHDQAVRCRARTLRGDVAQPQGRRGALGLGGKASEWDAADESLKSFAHMAVAAQVGCSWCLDISYFRRRTRTWTWPRRARCRAGGSRRCSRRWSGTSLEYAEAMTNTPPTVTDELYAAPARSARPGGDGRAHRVHRHFRTSRPGATRRTGSSRRASPPRARFRWPRALSFRR